jgi:hypothetical protein
MHNPGFRLKQDFDQLSAKKGRTVMSGIPTLAVWLESHAQL